MVTAERRTARHRRHPGDRLATVRIEEEREMSHEPAWERRFTATSVGFPAWSDAEPDRLALITTRSGASQVWTYDLGDGSWRQVTDDPVGIEHVMVAPDGRLVWWLDATGNERGHWVSAPFDGGEPRPLVRGVPDAWSMGISMVGDRVAVGCATDDDYRVYVARRRPGSPAGLPARAPSRRRCRMARRRRRALAGRGPALHPARGGRRHPALGAPRPRRGDRASPSATWSIPLDGWRRWRGHRAATCSRSSARWGRSNGPGSGTWIPGSGAT